MPVPIAFRCIVAHIHPAAEQKPPHSCFQAIGNGRFPPLLHPCRIWHTDKTRKGRVPYWSGTLPADGRRAGSKSARTMKPRPSETPPTIPCLLSGDTLRSLGFHPPTMIASLPTLDASRQLSGRGQSDDVHPHRRYHGHLPHPAIRRPNRTCEPCWHLSACWFREPLVFQYFQVCHLKASRERWGCMDGGWPVDAAGSGFFVRFRGVSVLPASALSTV